MNQNGPKPCVYYWHGKCLKQFMTPKLSDTLLLPPITLSKWSTPVGRWGHRQVPRVAVIHAASRALSALLHAIEVVPAERLSRCFYLRCFRMLSDGRARLLAPLLLELLRFEPCWTASV